MKQRLKKVDMIFSLAFLGLAFFSFTFASVSDGTISTTFKYAWGENIGWINFGLTQGNIHITDFTVTGYAWSENYGWINMAPAEGGVQNDGQGTLSGYAWGEGLGWINFDGVTINCSGRFGGTATGDNSGIIAFECANCNVTTDWRPLRCRGGPPPVSHNICENEKCISVSYGGENECQIDIDCLICTPDLNRDGFVDLYDFSILLFYWDETDPAEPCADINKDGIVGLEDFSIMLYWWTD